MTPLHLTCRRLDGGTDIGARGGTLIDVAGELDLVTTADLGTFITAVHPDPARPLLLDLAAVTFMDSTGLHLLIDLHQREERCGGSLHLAAPHERVTRVLQITGVHALLNTHPNLQQALAATHLAATPALN
ncbi:STAS domain-containing protein [Nonomuraea typhae]|uniref:STAS domain-containing protein n=1 Tax=Nonomuraea typhae TaxID=2603600 RepID=UPI0012FBF697|nr:STAS domain-containing protein [Nonomuraea typhae]